jgi:hypothetical protein
MRRIGIAREATMTTAIGVTVIIASNLSLYNMLRRHDQLNSLNQPTMIPVVNVTVRLHSMVALQI